MLQGLNQQLHAEVNFDLIVSTIPSIEIYLYGALFVHDHTGYKWLYRLKTKDEALDAAKRWTAEIADLREKHPLLVVMRDNTKENNSKTICYYCTSMGVKNYYSAGYEPWEDGLAEASIKLIIMLALQGVLLASPGKFCILLFPIIHAGHISCSSNL